MKKEYEAPKAEKVEFDYDEMVTASTGGVKESAKCDPCAPTPTFNKWMHCK